MKIILFFPNRTEIEALMGVTEVLRSGETHQTVAGEGNSLQRMQRLPFFLYFSVS